VQAELAWGRFEQVRASNYICDLLLGVVDHDCELISPESVPATDHEVSKGRQVLVPEYAIGERLPIQSRTEPNCCCLRSINIPLAAGTRIYRAVFSKRSAAAYASEGATC
jgi:hypothetical protein